MYTCTGSCGAADNKKVCSSGDGAEAYVYCGYVKEHIIIQPPPERQRRAVASSAVEAMPVEEVKEGGLPTVVEEEDV